MGQARIQKLGLALAISAINAGFVHAAPVLSEVVDGEFEEIDIVSNGTSTISQTSQQATINWDTFDVAQGETINFNNENYGTDSITINNIINDDVSEVFGTIKADGQIFLVNPNGFVFGTGSSIDAASFFASTSTSLSISDSTVTLGDSGTGSITQLSNSKISTNTEGGYIGFFAPSITVGGEITATNGQVVLSGQTTGTLTLPGLDIGFETSEITSPTINDITLESTARISGHEVILSASNLNDVIDGVINTPNVLTAENLILDTNQDVTIAQSGDVTATEIDSLVDGNNLTISANNITVEQAYTYDGGEDEARELTLDADNDLTVTSTITGANLDLTMIGETVTSEDNLDSDQINAITIQGTTANLSGNISAQEFISLESETTNLKTNPSSSDSSIVIQAVDSDSANNQVSITGNLIYDNTNSETADLSIQGLTTRLEVDSTEEISGFDSITLEANELYLAGNISADTEIELSKLASQDPTDIYLTADTNLESDSITLSNTTFASYSESSEQFDLTFTPVSDSSALNIELVEANDEISSNEYISSLASITVDNSDTQLTEINASGDFDVDAINMGYSTFRLTDDITFNGVDDFDAENSQILGEYTLSATSDSGSGTATVGQISNGTILDSASLSGFESITLTDDITVGSGGLSLEATTIYIEASDTSVALASQNDGAITLDGSTTSQSSSGLSLSVDSGDVTLDTVADLSTLSLTRNLDEGTTYLNGDITDITSLSFANAGAISVSGDVTSISASSMNLQNSQLTQNASDTLDTTNLTITASSYALLGDITGQDSLTISSPSTTMYGDISADYLYFTQYSGDDSHALLLGDDVALTGWINFLDASTTTNPSIDGNYDFILNTGDQDVTLYRFGSTTALSSFTLNGSGSLAFEILDEDNEEDTGIPVVNGTGGYTFTGGLDIEIDEAFSIDTSDFGGDINFSDTTINGSTESLSLNAGSGSIYLGDVGLDSSLPVLTIAQADTLYLNGDILLTDSTTGYDFSGVTNEIILQSDVTLGNEEMYSTVNFGSAQLNGTQTLTLYSDDITMSQTGVGENENNGALQGLNIYSNGDLTFDNEINLVGDANINANSVTLNNEILTTGANININTVGDLTMSADSMLQASNAIDDGEGNIALQSDTGTIRLGTVEAENTITITSTEASILNNIGDYVSSENTSINISASDITLQAGSNIGNSTANPVVLDITDNGSAELNAGGDIYIANLNQAEIVSSGDVVDSVDGDTSGVSDALGQLTAQALTHVNDPVVESTEGLIDNPTWQAEEDKSIRRLRTPVSTPTIKRTQKGWQLGSAE